MAPEVIQGLEYDWRADVFSYGVLLSYLHTRKRPYNQYNSGGVQALLISIVSGLRPTIEDGPEPLQRPLHELFLHCTSAGEDERPSFDKILSDLNCFVAVARGVQLLAPTVGNDGQLDGRGVDSPP